MALLPDETRAIETWTAGALGLLLRNADAPSLVSALKAVVSGIAAVDPQLVAAMVSASGISQPRTVVVPTPQEM